MPCHGCTIRRRAEKSDVGDGRTNPGDLKRRQRRAMKTSTAVAQALEPLHALFDKTTTLPGRRVTVARAAWDGQILITCYENRFLPFIFFSFFPSLSLSLSRAPHTSCRLTRTQANITDSPVYYCLPSYSDLRFKPAYWSKALFLAWRSKLALVAELVSQLPSSHCHTIASGFVIKMM